MLTKVVLLRQKAKRDLGRKDSLGCFPQPLLLSFLLNQFLVLQPSIRSLFQVLSSLKHKTDANKEDVEELVLQAQRFLINREERLSNTHRASQDSTSIPNGKSPYE